MKHTTIVLIRKENLEDFKEVAKENNIEITETNFRERSGWYPCDSYELTLTIPFEINIIKTLGKFNLYDGLTIKGLDGKDEGLALHLH